VDIDIPSAVEVFATLRYLHLLTYLPTACRMKRWVDCMISLSLGNAGCLRQKFPVP